MTVQYSVGANFVLLVTNWLQKSGKRKGYPHHIWTVRIWTLKFPGDIWIVEIWTVKTGLGLRLGLGLVFGFELVLLLLLLLLLVFSLWLSSLWLSTLRRVTTEQQPPLFGPCLLSSNGWMDQDAIWYGGACRPRPHCVTWEPSSPTRGTAAP